jgi:hypothetical protein
VDPLEYLPYRVSCLKAKVIVFDIQLKIWQNQLKKEIGDEIDIILGALLESIHTSSRIFFHIILVISSPSSSTTGFLTRIFSIANSVEIKHTKSTSSRVPEAVTDVLLVVLLT